MRHSLIDPNHFDTEVDIAGHRTQPSSFDVEATGAAISSSSKSAVRWGLVGLRFGASSSLLLAAWLLAGCTAPIGANRVSAQQAYGQVAANALRTGKPSAETVALLHRYDLDRLAASQPDEAVRRLHEKAVATGDRDLLFALSEMSYVAGHQIQHSLKPWDLRDERDYYLGSAVYAWLYLFSQGQEPAPSPFERRFRLACDFYNYSLGMAFTERKGTNGVVQLRGGPRRLPVGAIELRLKETPAARAASESESILLADHFLVHGLSVRNREAGLGAPLICVGPLVKETNLRRSAPATVFLRLPGSLGEISAGQTDGVLEIYSPETTSVAIGGAQVPLETDLTICLAYNLNQSTIWKLGSLQFLDPGAHIKSQLIFNQPYDPGRIPVVFVHGTFSSPVTWAEMVNSLLADPVLRRRYQIWSFIYGSGQPLVNSVRDLRKALTETVNRLDPQSTNAALSQMVVIGHSQGGLLVKGTAINSGDRIWQVLSTNRFDRLRLPAADRANLEQLVFLKPLPFVSRVVFISTPHRGSYLAGSFVRQLAARFVALPGNLAARGKDIARVTAGSEAGHFLGGRMPTSLDGMSPRNPALLATADIPVVPPIKANSIIAVRGGGDYHDGRDGLVAYQSAHVDYAESEFIVRSFHTCLDNPATIEEVRRILHAHLRALPPSGSPPAVKPPSGSSREL